MTLLYIFGALFAVTLAYAWARTSDSFTAYCITESVEYVGRKARALCQRIRGEA